MSDQTILCVKCETNEATKDKLICRDCFWIKVRLNAKNKEAVRKYNEKYRQEVKNIAAGKRSLSMRGVPKKKNKEFLDE